VSTDVGTEPLTLDVLVTTPDVPLFEALGQAFTEKYPNVTVNVDSQDYAALTTNIGRILSGTDVPDIVRIASFGNLVDDGLLTDLDPYADAYGWSSWPQSQFDSTRVDEDGQRGSGSLFGVGPGFGLTGVYYNIGLAEQIGMTTPPASLDEFENALSSAKSEGILPIVINGKDGGTGFMIQNLQMDFAGGTQTIQDWTYNVAGASIDTPATVEAAATLQEWSEKGYLSADVNAVDQSQAPALFTGGTGLFFPSGNWQAPGLDQAGAGEFGFFLFPPAEEGGEYSAMTAAATLSIPTKAEQATAAGAFLDFIQTDEGARQATVDLGGVVPAGPLDASTPATQADSVVAATVASFQQLLESDGLADFMANASASINVNGIIPQTQLLVAGQTTPDDYATALQDEYLRELGG
jgi:ABC-type glycerol-3-phosphate transport system substrate-binding protein